MRLEARKYLYDIKQAADLLGEFTAGKQFSDYRETPMLRAAVERKCEIIGEALSKLSRVGSAIVSNICVHQSGMVLHSDANQATSVPVTG